MDRRGGLGVHKTEWQDDDNLGVMVDGVLFHARVRICQETVPASGLTGPGFGLVVGGRE